MENTFKIIDPIGLHARPASLIVSAASKFKSTVTFTYLGKKGNAKSIMNLMALGARTGGEITITTVGEDENTAFETLVDTMKKAKLI